MTVQLELLSERVQAAGGFQGGAVLKLLGTPRMDELTLLVREAVQNSWDARWPKDSQGTVDFHVRVFTLSPEQRAAITNVFSTRPFRGSSLGEVLSRQDILVAEIRDEGTTGLNGPTRADRVTDGSRNFVDFIRNIGAPQDRDASGGTYGFGKGSYYRASEAHAIVVHSHSCAGNGAIESRLIAAAVGNPFLNRSVPYTGRHFWGIREDADDFVEPATGVAADELAASVGMGVPNGLTGTSILVVGFRTGIDRTSEGEGSPRDGRAAAQLIAHQLAWQCWPKLVSRDNVPPMRFFVECEGERVDVPTVERVPALDALAENLRAIHREEESVIEIRSQKPRKLLGHLAFKTFFAPVPRLGFGTEPAAGFEVPTHHVALLRTPELVVRYLPGPASDMDDHGWVGVFLTSHEVDRSFAAAEPPTHDDWVKDQVVDQRQRRDVNIALREIDAAVKSRFAIERPSRQGPRLAVASLAAALGDVFRTPGLDSSRAPATSPKAKGAGPGGGRRTEAIRQVAVRLALVENTPAHVITLDTDSVSRQATLEAHVSVAVDDGVAEDAPPFGSAVPTVVGWLIDGELLTREPVLERVPVASTYEVAVEHLAGVMPLVFVTPIARRP